MIKKLRSQRLQLEELIQIYDLKTNEIIGHVLDINHQGLGVFIAHDLSNKQIMEIRLKLIKQNKCIQYIDLITKVCWCKKSSKLQNHIAGLKIETIINTKSKMRFEDLLQSLYQIKSEKIA
ncbi:MAG: PilZ domain-containing protein [Marinicellaceae bacterium]